MTFLPLNPDSPKFEKQRLAEAYMERERFDEPRTRPVPHVWDRYDPSNGQHESVPPSNQGGEETVENAPVVPKLTAENPPSMVRTLLGGLPKPEHQVEVSGQGNALQHSNGFLWPDLGPIDLSGYEWFEKLTQELNGVGLSQVMSVLAPLIPLSATVGSAYWIQPPGAGAVSPALNLVIQARTGSQVRQAVDGLFLSALAKQRQVKSKVTLPRHQIDLLLKEKISQFLALNHRIEKLEADDSWAGPVHHMLASPEVKHARKLRDDLKGLIRELVLGRRPDLLVQDTAIQKLQEPRQLAFDGMVHHLSTSGNAWAQLPALGRKNGAGVAASFAATWRPICLNEGVPPTFYDIASATWVLRENQVREFLMSPRIQGFGVSDQFLVVDGSSAPGANVYCARGEDLLVDLLDQVWQERVAGHVKVLGMDEDASEEYLMFLRDRHRLALELGDRACMLLDRVGPLLAKLALLFHIIRNPNPACSVDIESVRIASILCDHLIIGHLSILDNCLARQVQEKNTESQIEMIERRLLLKGPMSMRELMRSFHAVRRDDIAPIIEEARNKGSVAEVDGKFVLVQRPGE
jgi:hypothetical protein